MTHHKNKKCVSTQLHPQLVYFWQEHVLPEASRFANDLRILTSVFLMLVASCIELWKGSSTYETEITLEGKHGAFPEHNARGSCMEEEHHHRPSCSY